MRVMATKNLKTAMGVMILLAGILVRPSFGFAQGNGTESELANDLVGFVDLVISFISRAWIIPAWIAGKLMTNSVVYGSAIYMDVYLWKLRQYMRTAAYFTLGVVFFVKIILHFIKQEGAEKIGETIKNVIIAGLLIPATWAVMAALIDISIVGTAAIGSLPLQIVQDNREKIKVDVTAPKRVVISDEKIDIEDLNRQDNIKTLELEDIMPQGDTVAGPLIFIGASMVNFFDMSEIPDSQRNLIDISLQGLIKLLLAVMMVLPMVILMIVNMIRVFYLWIWIIFGPFIVLDVVFKGPLSSNNKTGKIFKPGNIIGLIFQPVAVVGMLSIGLVLIMGLFDILAGGTQYSKEALGDLQVVQYSDTEASIGTQANSEVIVKGSLFHKAGEKLGGAIGTLILSVFIIILLRGLVQVGFSFSELTSNTAKSLFKFAGDGLQALPIIPLGTGGVSVGEMKKGVDTLTSRSAGFDKKIARQTAQVESALGLKDDKRINHEELVELGQLSLNKDGKYGAFWQRLKKIQEKRELSPDEVKPYINRWIMSGGRQWLGKQGVIPNQKPDEALVEQFWAGKAPYQNFVKFVDGVLKASTGAQSFDTPDFIQQTMAVGDTKLKTAYGAAQKK